MNRPREDWELTKSTQRGGSIEAPWLNDPEFQRLKAEWEIKLNDTPGCMDIDPFDGRGYMHRHHLHSKKAAIRGEVTGEAELWRIRSAWTQHARWRSPRERFLWVQWTAGTENAKYIFQHSTVHTGLGSLRSFRTWLLAQSRAAVAWAKAEDRE